MPLELYTARYQAFADRMGVPVRTTVGVPRWKLNYPLVHHLREATPTSAMVSGARSGRLDEEGYRGLYVARLDEIGAAAIAAAAMKIARQASADRLVLLCFDDLTKPGEWCHRTMFADWWLTRTGDQVREIGSVPDREPSRPARRPPATVGLACDADPVEPTETLF